MTTNILALRRHAQPQTLIVVSTEGMSKEMLLLATAFQGIINQRAPRVFLAADKDPQNKFWLDFYRSRFGIRTEAMDFQKLLQTFRELVGGYVIYDPQLGATANIACTLAGIESFLPAHPSHVGMLAELGIRQADDLRGRWRSAGEAYRWAIRELLPKCSRTLVGHTPLPDSLETPAPRPPVNPYRIVDRDFLVVNRAFMFSVCNSPDKTFPGQPDEAEIVDLVYRHLAPFASVMGWMNWWTDIQAFWEADYAVANSKYGLNTICGGGGNFSVHCAIGAGGEFRQAAPAPDALKLEDKIYVAFGLSDGDAFWCIHNQFGDRWNDALRGSIPLGWTMNPMATEFAPAMYRYYLENATPADCFVAPSAGVFYLCPSLIPDLEGYLKINEAYLRQSDIHVIMGLGDVADNVDQYLDFGDIKREKIVPFLKMPSLWGMVEGYGPRYRPERPWREQIWSHAGKPWLLNVYEDDFTWFKPPTPQKILDAMLKIGRRETGRPLFLPFFLGLPHGATLGMIAEVAAELRNHPEFKVVRPDEQALLFRKWSGHAL